MGFGTRTLEVSGMWNKDPLNLKLSHNKDEKKQTKGQPQGPEPCATECPRVSLPGHKWESVIKVPQRIETTMCELPKW